MVTPFISQTRARQRDGINVKRGNCSLSLTWSWVFSLTGLWCASPHFFGGIPLNKTTFCPIEELFWKQQRCKITLELQLQHNSCLLGNNQEGGMSVDPHRWKGHSLTVFLFFADLQSMKGFGFRNELTQQYHTFTLESLVHYLSPDFIFHHVCSGLCVRVLLLGRQHLLGGRGVDPQPLLQMCLSGRQGPVFSGGMSAGGLQTCECHRHILLKLDAETTITNTVWSLSLWRFYFLEWSRRRVNQRLLL